MRRLISKSNLAILFAAVAFAAASKVIFDDVYITANNVIDEAFHLPQGLAYCNYNFDKWDPKITTLPGLYLITAFALGPLDLCEVYWLRFINLAASVVNLLLFYALFKSYERQVPAWKHVFSSLNLSLLPPLYFFNHLYYTDVTSITVILLLLLFERRKNHVAASICGMLSIVMRQTNIIWVIMLFGKYVLRYTFCTLAQKQASSCDDYKVTLNDIKKLQFINKKQFVAICNFPRSVLINIATYLAVFVSFGMFVILNGSIVVGDKEAHTMVVHFPQLLYFMLFFLAFAWPYSIVKLPNFIRFLLKNKFALAVVTVLMAFVVYFNTLIHPYLLADNRHYTFYVWNYFYGRYRLFRYFIIPLYLFGLYCMTTVLKNLDLSFGVAYVVCTSVMLALQKLIEIRYFLIPFIILRLNLKDVKVSQLVLELIYYLLVNYATFRVFFNKDVYWIDFDEPQKIIW